MDIVSYHRSRGKVAHRRKSLAPAGHNSSSLRASQEACPKNIRWPTASELRYGQAIRSNFQRGISQNASTTQLRAKEVPLGVFQFQFVRTSPEGRAQIEAEGISES